MKYSMTCSCGYKMEKEAATRADAVAALKADMTEEAITKHMKEMHKPGEVVPTVAEVHAGIDQMTQPMA